MCIVHLFEAVEIDEQDSALPAVAGLGQVVEHVRGDDPVRQSGQRIAIGQHVHAQDIGVEPPHHLAEAVSQSADLAGAIDIDRAVKISGHDRFRTVAQRADLPGELGGGRPGDRGRDDNRAAHDRGDERPGGLLIANADPEIKLSADAKGRQHPCHYREPDRDAV